MSRYIKTVAIYLRKSRGDEENNETDVLKKHRNLLVEYCKKEGWEYVIYEEIGSGDSLIGRPKMMKLLNDIRESKILIDAVLVIDYDRLGRGDGEDQARIKKTLAQANVLLVTGEDGKNYDFNDDSDDMVTDMYGMVARLEYKMIKRRMMRGKKEGAKMGKWVNGIPPLPYIRDLKTKTLVIDNEKLPLYRKIIDMALNGYSANEIAWTLNKEGYRSKRGLLWSPKVIRDTLKDETHLGKIIYQKYKGDAHKDRPNKYKLERRPRSEWIIVENCHEAVKTQEEHDRILDLLNKRKTTPVKARQRKYPLSGLITCGKCGRVMQMRKKGNTVHIRCGRYDKLGNLCDNIGGNSQWVIDAILDKLKIYKDELSIALEESDGGESEIIQKEIEIKVREINKKQKALERTDEAFEEGIYDIERYRERRQKINNELERLDDELEALQRKLDSAETITNIDRIRIIDEFFERFSREESNEEKNRLLMLVLKNVTWLRTEKTIDININVDINFL